MTRKFYSVEANGKVAPEERNLSYNDAYWLLQEYGERGFKVRMFPTVKEQARIGEECKECGGVH